MFHINYLVLSRVFILTNISYHKRIKYLVDTQVVFHFSVDYVFRGAWGLVSCIQWY